MLPKISIITVVRNDPKGLELTLANIKQFNYPSLEMVLIDGASTDSTMDVVAKYSDLLDVVVSEPDKGLYDAMNKGLTKATGDFVWFINAGDTIRCNGCEMSEVFESNSNPALTPSWSDIAIVYGDTQVVDSEGVVLGLRRKPLPRVLDQWSFRRGMVVCHQSILIARSVAPLYDTSFRFSADVEWVQSSIEVAVARKMRLINSGLIISSFAEGGLTSQNRKKSLKERFRIMRNHYGLFSTVWSHMIFAIESFFRSDYRKL